MLIFIWFRSPRPLRGQCHEAQRRDIVVSVSRPWLARVPHLYSVRTSLPLAQKFCSFFSIPALLVVLAAGSRIAVCPAASTFVFPTCQRTNYKSTRGGLLAFGFALRELALCPARYRTERLSQVGASRTGLEISYITHRIFY